MNKSFILIPAILFSGLLTAGETVLAPDFKQAPAKAELNGSSARNGKLYVTGKDGFASAKFALADFRKDCEINFTIRPVGKKNEKSGGHFGIDFFFCDGSTMKFFSYGKQWIGLYGQPGREGKYLTVLEATSVPTGKATAVKIIFRSKNFTLSSGKDLSLPIGFSFPGIKAIAFYGYEWSTIISDFSVKYADAPKKATAEPKKVLLDEEFENAKEAPEFKVVKGVTGKGITINDGKTKTIEIGRKIGPNGTIMLWGRSNTHDAFHLFAGLDQKNKKVFEFLVDPAGMNTQLGRKNGASMQASRRVNFNAFSPNEWFYYAISFDESGLVHILYNAYPYYNAIYGYNQSQYYTNLDLDSISKLTLTANRSFDKIKVVNYAMNVEEMTNEFRKIVPVDIMMNDLVVTPGKSTVLTFKAAPCGTFFIPDFKVLPVKKAGLTAKLFKVGERKTDDKLIAEKKYSYSGSAIKKYTLPAITLNKNEQVRLSIEVNGVPWYTRVLQSWKVPAAKPAVNADYKKGKLLFEKKLTDPNDSELVKKGVVTKKGNYLELGKKKYDCVAFEIDIPRGYRNRQPLVLEIDWPDDAARFMGLYLYKPSVEKQLRDCLDGCVTAGNQYPNSGKIKTERWIIFPCYESYLFEARTMGNGMPGAISAVRLYALDGGLPKLKVNYPAGLPHRTFGHLDEDSSFDYLFDHQFGGKGVYNKKVGYIIDMLMDYLDYTGHEVWAYPMIRYQSAQLIRSTAAYYGTFPFQPELQTYWIRSMRERGKQWHGIINLYYGIPEIHQCYEVKYANRSDFFRRTPFGEKRSQNIFHPEVQKMFFGHVERMLEQFATDPAFTAIDFWCLSKMTAREPDNDVPTKYVEHFEKLGVFSYDDYNMANYRREADPAMPDFKGNDRYMKRFEYLLKPENEKKWYRWNRIQVGKFLNKLRAVMDKYNKNIILNIATNGDYSAGFSQVVATGVTDPRICFVVGRNPTHFYWNIQYSDKLTNLDIDNFGKVGGFPHTDAVESFYSYGETFTDSPSPDYASYFQNIDMKAPGRHALRDPAYALARHDMFRFQWGGQPLAAMGREAYVREFTQAYCALPAMKFTQVPGMTDPVTVRYCNTKNGTYVYCVNVMHTPCTVTLKGVDEMQDLSDLSTVKADAITLKPYQLRSFLVKGKRKVSSGSVKFPAEFFKFYEQKFAEAQATIDLLRKAGIGSETAAKSLAKAKALYQKKCYSEAHAQLFSPDWYRANQLTANQRDIALIGDMLKKRTLRVNCGANTFTKLPDGRVFVPDAAFADGRGYGYTGNVLFCTRGIDGINRPDKELFTTEAYNIVDYRVKLPNGNYDVRLYLRWGYGPAFNLKNNDTAVANDVGPSKLRNRIRIGNEVREIEYNRDMKYSMKNVIILDFKNVRVSGGLLKIEMLPYTRILTGCQLLNAVEVSPAK